VTRDASPAADSIRVAEVIAALSLATDLGIGAPLEHGLHSKPLAMRLADRLKVNAETATQTYYACQLARPASRATRRHAVTTHAAGFVCGQTEGSDRTCP
jgi:hypothetical protein